jgi:hypothetical protein
MPLDVLALQYLYGQNQTTNSGNSAYTLPLNNLYATIWDSSGDDTIDVSSSPVAWTIALPKRSIVGIGIYTDGIRPTDK